MHAQIFNMIAQKQKQIRMHAQIIKHEQVINY
jgi:hypothetical protein